MVRKALDLTSWEAAQRLIRDWEAVGVVTAEAVTVEDAVKKYLADCEARKLKEATMVQRRRLLQKRLLPWCTSKGIRFLGLLGVEELREFRESWTVEPVTALKQLERLRSFMSFARDSGWLKDNPARLLRPPKVPPKPTLPFTQEEMGRILAACDEYPKKSSFGYDNKARMRAFVLLLRYSGLRLQDATTIEKKRIDGGRLFLYTAKTGTPVFVPLPPLVIEALDAVKRPDEPMYFWNGNGTAKSAMTVWDRSLRKLFEIAKVEGGHAHRFRHTFAVELLAKGVSMETVSLLLGHSSLRVTEKHYSAFVKARQIALEDAVKLAWA